MRKIAVPDWLDRELFPFESRFVHIDNYRLHYIDEGKGEPILFVHGTPEWSFGFRELIKGLKGDYRCLALDHLGFGLSDKAWYDDFTLIKHAQRLERFIDKLNLKGINIVANDFGGSIALSYAIQYPENVKRICLFNTWMWSLSDDRHFARPGRFIHTWAGRLLYRRFNFAVRVMMPMAYGDRSKLTRNIHAHYKAPLSKPAYRKAAYTLAKEILDADRWWDCLWEDLDVLKEKPFLIIWGLKDRLIPPRMLQKWISRLPDAKVVTFENAGHFVQEEEPAKTVEEIRNFLQ